MKNVNLRSFRVITPKGVIDVIHREHQTRKTFEVKFDKSDYVKHGHYVR